MSLTHFLRQCGESDYLSYPKTPTHRQFPDSNHCVIQFNESDTNVLFTLVLNWCGKYSFPIHYRFYCRLYCEDRLINKVLRKCQVTLHNVEFNSTTKRLIFTTTLNRKNGLPVRFFLYPLVLHPEGIIFSISFFGNVILLHEECNNYSRKNSINK